MNTHAHNHNARINARPLRSTLHGLAAGIAALVLGWPLPALADCVDTRKPTAGEMEFHSRAIAALVAALPPLPVGAKLHNKDSFPSLGQQCQGQTGDFTLEATRNYEHNSRLAIVSIQINVRQLPVSGTDPSEAYGAASPARSAGLKVNNVVWRISGSDSPLRKTLAEAIDRTRLQALVGKPLPTVAESQALAAQATPATVAGASMTAPATAAAPAANAPAAQPVAAPASAGQPAAPEPMRDAVDTVNRLRGLFGR
jgi:hypothetical protein